METISQECNRILKHFDGLIFKLEQNSEGSYCFRLCEGALAERFELTTEKVSGRTIYDFFSEGSAKKLNSLIEEVVAGNEINTEFLAADREFLIKALPDYKDGELVGVIGTGVDITKLKQACRALLHCEQHFSNEMSSIFNFFPDGIIVLSQELKLLRNNYAFKNIIEQYSDPLGLTKTQLLNKILEKVIVKIKDKDRHPIHIEPIAESQNSLLNKLILQVDFAEFNLNFQSSFIIVSLKDIAERYLLEKEKDRLFHEYIKTISTLDIHILRVRLEEDGKHYITFSEGKNLDEKEKPTDFYYGKTLEEFATNKHLLKYSSFFEKAFKGEETKFVYSFKEKRILVNVFPFEKDENGRVVEVLISGTLISE
ncbi:MAG: PAS domain-containing protein [Ignavibacteria bacterium]|nr:PAS domain-containing protein [Ignavibacteria bacterium]